MGIVNFPDWQLVNDPNGDYWKMSEVEKENGSRRGTLQAKSYFLKDLRCKDKRSNSDWTGSKHPVRITRSNEFTGWRALWQKCTKLNGGILLALLALPFTLIGYF